MTIADTLDAFDPKPGHRVGAPTRFGARPERPILIIPGVNGSGPTHWQSLWERSLPGAERVEQNDWDHPNLADWTAGLAEAVRRRPGALLVAHSLGCALVAHFARITGGRGVGGALLVAPADVDADSCRRLADFGPIPLEHLAFPSLVVASRNDPFISLTRAETFAKAWGSRLIDLGPVGHVNVESGHGHWAEGLALLESLAGAITRSEAG